MDKVRSTLKQFVRDWSAEGAKERRQCYLPVIKEIMDRFPVSEMFVHMNLSFENASAIINVPVMILND